MAIYLFDFDGTLVDSMPTFASVMLRILDEHGIAYGPDIVKTITPLGYAGTARYFIELGIQATEEELVAKMKRYATKEYAESIPEKPHVGDALRHLLKKGHRPSVLTASPHEMLDVCLRRLGLYGLFENVWSCDDFGLTKADPEIYRQAAKCLGADVGEVVFLDDNLGALKTAKSAGMRVYGVYDPTSRDLAAKIRTLSDRYITSFSELLDE